MERVRVNVIIPEIKSVNNRWWSVKNNKPWKLEKEYRAWYNMMDRCYNIEHWNYPNYGARGITVCEHWHSFHNFLVDMGMAPSVDYSLDRYPNNDGIYEATNCRWATCAEQMRNLRNTLLVPWKGEMIPAIDLAVILGKDPLIYTRHVWQRIYRNGYTPEEAVKEDKDGRSGDKRMQRSEALWATVDGLTLPVVEHCNRLGLKYKTIVMRILRGMTPENALTIPLRNTQTHGGGGKVKYKVWLAGIERPVIDVCKEHGKDLNKVYTAIKKGVTPEAALGLPSRRQSIFITKR